jgi:hypothetical protein
MTNAIKVLLQMTSVSLQPVPTLHNIALHWFGMVANITPFLIGMG